MSLRRSQSSKIPKDTSAHVEHTHTHSHEHEHEDRDHNHNHSHSHSFFGGHSHSHGTEGAEKLVQALQGHGDRGSQITLIGLFSNVLLMASKGAAGWYMHSASLLAEAGHSLSDLMGDFVTLFCYKFSRRPPTEQYPYGFAKFETLGTTTVSLLLIGGALGIGFHSYHLLIEALGQTAATLPAGPVQDLLQNVTAAAHHVPSIGHSHGHGHGHVADLDPNAAWFAAISVIAKEWLYRITKKVADEERSPVLLANAIHHRSDAYSSVVVLFAILGSWWFPALPLDPIGGLLVSAVILRQSWGVLVGAFSDLTDAGIPSNTRRAYTRALEPLLATSPSSSDLHLLAIRYLRAKRTGSVVFVDLTADVPRAISVAQAASLEDKIEDTLKRARKEVAEVRVRFHPVDDNGQI